MSQNNTTNENDGNTAEQLRTIFTEEEIRSTVKAFVLAYLRGTITIQFDSADDIIAENKKLGKEINYSKAIKQEVDLKIGLTDAIDVIAGTIESTPEELETSIKDIFRDILALRAGGRIHGTFLEFDIEKKIDDIEIKLNATNKVVQELVNWLTDEAKNANKLS